MSSVLAHYEKDQPGCLLVHSHCVLGQMSPGWQDMVLQRPNLNSEPRGANKERKSEAATLGLHVLRVTNVRTQNSVPNRPLWFNLKMPWAFVHCNIFSSHSSLVNFTMIEVMENTGE